MTYDTDVVKCTQEGCEATFKNHRWGKIKADDWFHQKDGKSYCPKHIPEWVANWRMGKASR